MNKNSDTEPISFKTAFFVSLLSAIFGGAVAIISIIAFFSL